MIRNSKFRAYFFSTIIIIIFFVYIYRLYFLQIDQHEKWQKLAVKTHTRNIPYFYKRGTIYDRNYEQYAFSTDVKSLYCEPYRIKNIDDTVYKLSMILPINKKKYINKIKRFPKKRFLWLWRNIPIEYIHKIRALSLKGVGFKTEYKRIFPEKDSCSNVLGFVGVDSNNYLDNNGLEGIEYKFDSMLKGYLTHNKVTVDGKGKIILDKENKNKDIQHARNIVLTIDKVIQHKVEEELDIAMKKYSPKSIMAIVYDASNGEILAMGNKPDFDPNNYNKYSYSSYKNRCITDIFEPGSTLKIITVSSAIDTGTLDESFKVKCNGKIRVDKGDPITCEVPHGEVGLEKILIHSCNVGAVSVGMAVGKDILYNYDKRFGLGTKTGILLTGEVNGKVRNVRSWGVRDQASISFGYAVAVTAIQMITGLSCVINDGFVMRPRIIKQITDNNGRIIHTTVPTRVRQAIKSETAHKMMKILEKVVNKGSGRRAYIPGYKLMGKTGTAQKLEKKGGYSKNKYRVSFIGFMKSKHHNLSVYVVVDNPKAKKVFGGTIAAPIVKNIFKHLIRYYDIPAIEEKIETKKMTKITVPNFIGITKKEMLKRKKMFKLNIIVEGKGDKVTFQFPDSNSSIRMKSKVYVYCGISENTEVIKGCMPYLIDKTLKEALIFLKKAGIKYNVSGNGIVKEQYPIAGSKIDKDTVVKIICKSK